MKLKDRRKWAINKRYAELKEVLTDDNRIKNRIAQEFIISKRTVRRALDK